ncbi:CDP-glucose 4,6-dehydratase [Paraburkholderia azotifigens]|uniref:CDP-glucose 4,6-dehydratase n=1 Tax=Paraburkholderia azotifigens TaxID=2057004 RepID=A0A5C6VX44_9BURK|nr:CDP-glucose 4,6-dehydratase [Paraburkholderia azotifigens]TXC89186.1 CDP-glucose 4,6-dehydratase [Paraburkholderia azotifigens]
MVLNESFWSGRRVFLTGHTGFKGGWLALWLSEMGAEVHGYALAAATTPSFYEVTKLADRLACSTIADIRDAHALRLALQAASPDIVLHLAARPLVRYSYAEPAETYAVNVMGVVNLFEAVRQTPTVRAVLNITTDKCYENREKNEPYAEDEALGGYDPYSSSKACSELVTSAYRRSFFAAQNIALASARAGNVIGGGDWSTDRLVPDFLRAIDAGKPLVVRYPHAVRPWQHVLEPLSGYLQLAEKLYTENNAYAEAWNFGSEDADARSVEWIADRLCALVPGTNWHQEKAPQQHEAGILKLNSNKAKQRLNWHPRWTLDEALVHTVDWHLAWREGADMQVRSLMQIGQYTAAQQATQE